MSYTLQAIVALAEVTPASMPTRLRSVPLKCGVELFPLGEDAARTFDIPFCPLTDGGNIDLPASIQEICAELSQCRTIAYIEAESFGGTGTQACVVFKNGKRLNQVVVSDTAINQALIVLGVDKGDAFDHFEAVGLGQYRDTDEWFK